LVSQKYLLGRPTRQITRAIVPPQQNAGEKDIFVKTKIIHDKNMFLQNKTFHVSENIF